MRKTYPLRPEGKNPDRVLDAVKHDIRKYMKRERRRDLPEGATFWDFDCRFGADKDSAQTANPAELIGLLDVLAKAGGEQCYVELLAKPGVRQPRPAGQEVIDDAGASPAPSDSDD
ncbi:DUF6172 family protein [Hydrogenophaga aromaticivorans]|jgi:hypothetical protein|uniref:DUF6172 family protein n=1 Tax=Hydrogenophaga TaxID=47420 RepID=UPI001B383F84|nr:DUF6172 family protein [Hydrogenophaga aromaticivorans]MBQ0920592.1 hypothetical protein [Hydrogenophaga aromaticivorans]MBW8314692.1 hypothetical protein [Hydrogenophaga sp.]